MNPKIIAISNGLILKALSTNQNLYSFRLKTGLSKQEKDFFKNKGFELRQINNNTFEISWKLNTFIKND